MEKDKYSVSFLKKVSGEPDGVLISEAFEKRMGELLPSFRLLDIASSFFYVFDFARMRYMYISENVKDIMGYSSEEWTKEGVDFVFSTVYKEDVIRLKELHSALFDYYYSLPLSERQNLKYGFEFRVVRKDERIIWILQQGTFIELDKEGKPVVTFDILSDVTEYKKNKTMTLTMVKDHESSKFTLYFPINVKAKFSKREIEIIKLIAEHLNSKKIGEQLFISPHTVDTHRRNMLKKSGVRDSTELVYYARENGLI